MLITILTIIIIIYIVKYIFRAVGTSKYKCCSCKREFTKDEVIEWIIDYDQDDDNGDNPCCPYCGSDDVDEI